MSSFIGSPSSWIVSFLTIDLACILFTGKNLSLHSDVWRDLTIYLCFTDCERVDFSWQKVLLALSKTRESLWNAPLSVLLFWLVFPKCELDYLLEPSPLGY